MKTYVYGELLGRDVVNNDAGIGVLDVTGDERSIPLLPGCIPQLQSNGFVVDLQCFREEIYSDGRLHNLRSTAGVSL